MIHSRLEKLNVLAVALTLSGLSLSTLAQAQSPRTESSWQELVDEPSRADLFKENAIPAGLKEYGKAEGATLAIPPIFVFVTDATTDKIENKPRENCIFGIDVDHYGPKSLRFDLLKLQGVSFVYAKATQGTNFKVGNFQIYWEALAKLDPEDAVRRGAYHFLSSLSPGGAQADAFVDYVNLHGGFKPNDLPPAVDLEWDKTKTTRDLWASGHHSADDIIANTLACLRQIKQRTGRTPVLYTATSFLEEHDLLAKYNQLSEFPLWIADYNNKRRLAEKPSLPSSSTRATLWQFTDSARFLQDIGQNADASIFYGTPAEFETVFGQPKSL
jgi:lysozyme